MKTIILGCSYNSLQDLFSILKERTELEVLTIQEILSFNHLNHILQLKNGKSLSIEDVKCSFIRYPYDLIPPHNETFELRERTEFLKSIALLLNEVSINAVESTWMLRNRLFSLIEVSNYGADVPNIDIFQNEITKHYNKPKYILKAMGNCFVSETRDGINNTLLPILRKETDGGDTAYILPAEYSDTIDLDSYIKAIGVAFTQEAVISDYEYRGYLVGDRFFQYKRSPSSFVDRSASDYLKTNYVLSPKNQKAIRSLAEKYSLGYLCFDFIHVEGIDYIIDINPYGSMPKRDYFPEVQITLGELIINKIRM